MCVGRIMADIYSTTALAKIIGVAVFRDFFGQSERFRAEAAPMSSTKRVQYEGAIFFRIKIRLVGESEWVPELGWS